MKRLIVAVAVSGALICVCGASVTGVWTGAEDGYWTNANNWANGAMPGRVLGLDGGGNVVTNGVKGDTARFNGSETGAKITEIMRWKDRSMPAMSSSRGRRSLSPASC